MQNITTVQWACFAGIAALLLYPRLGGLKGVLTGLWAKITSYLGGQVAPNANAYAAAYRLLAPLLEPTTAEDVRKQLTDHAATEAKQTMTNLLAISKAEAKP